MNNLYQGFRGDPGQRAPPQSLSGPQTLLQPGKDQLPPGGLSASGFPLPSQLNGSMRHVNSAASSLPFPAQPWSDLPPSTSQSQLLQHHSQLNFSQQQQQLGGASASFASNPSIRPVAGGLSGRRAPVSNHQLYEDPAYAVRMKGFPEGAIPGNASLSGQPDSMLSASLLQHQTRQDMYSRHPQPGGNAVFDPSEFPSLGGGANTTQQSVNSASSLLGTSTGFDSMASNFTAPTQSGLNGISGYGDVYGLGAYSNPGRSKAAVDALTGSGPAGEFTMQNEDFPALGGGTNGANSARRGNTASAPQGVSLDNPASGHSRLAHASADGGFYNPSSQTPLHEHFGGLSLQGGIGSSSMSAGLMQIPQSTSMPYNIQKAKNAAAPSLLQPDQIASQLGQQAIEELARLAPTNQQHVERDVARSAIGQELFDRSNFSVPPNPYLSQGPLYDRGRPVGGTVPVAGGGVGGLNFDGNTASREPCAKGAATSLMNLSDAADPVLRSSAQEAVASTTSINGQVTPQGESSSLSTQLAFNANNASVVIPEELAPAEKYGMKGLLGVLNPPQGQQGNSNISLLSLGLDLTMLGLNLNSPDPLHLSFDSPWDSSNGPNKGGWDEVIGGPRGDEPDFKLPACYYMSPPALKTSHFTKFQLETLFYIFYNLPRDVLQQLAAMELHTREWRYHKELQLWFTRAPGTDATYERGAYIYFDISSWERRPFHDANITFEQGLMGDDELHVLPVPQHMSSAS